MRKVLVLVFTFILLGFVIGCGSVEAPLDKSDSKNPKVKEEQEPNKDESSNNIPSNSEPTNNKIGDDGKGNVPNSENPHGFSEFTKDDVFIGGNTVNNYALTGVRRLPHVEFTRLSFDFSQGREGATSADLSPGYEVSYKDSEKKLIAIFKGVEWNLIEEQTEEIKGFAPIIEDIKFKKEENNLHVIITLKEKIAFQVFDLNNPARVAIVLSPENGIRQ